MSENLKPENKALIARLALPTAGFRSDLPSCAMSLRDLEAIIDAAREEGRAPQAGEPKPVAWMVHGSGAAFLMHDEPKNGVAPGLTVTPLFANPPKPDPDVVRLVEFDWRGLVWATMERQREAGESREMLARWLAEDIRAALAPFSALGEG